jgi:hypothetical protein
MRVFEAWRRGMKSIAVSDHDVFDGQAEAVAAAELFGIDLVPSAEFYTSRPGVEIIAHFPAQELFAPLLERNAFASLVEPIRAAKARQLAGMIARIPDCFAKLGFKAEITEADIARYVRNGVSTKGDISVVMTAKYGAALRAQGLSADVKDFQLRYTTRDGMLNLPLDLDMDLSPEAFVRRVRSWGGLPASRIPPSCARRRGSATRPSKRRSTPWPPSACKASRSTAGATEYAPRRVSARPPSSSPCAKNGIPRIQTPSRCSSPTAPTTTTSPARTSSSAAAGTAISIRPSDAMKTSSRSANAIGVWPPSDEIPGLQSAASSKKSEGPFASVAASMDMECQAQIKKAAAIADKNDEKSSLVRAPPLEMNR